MIIVVVQIFDVLISVYVFVYTQTLVDVGDLLTCCNNRAAFICFVGPVMVVALAFGYC